MKKPKFPLEVKAGAVRVKIYNVSTPERERYTLAYYDGPERKIRQFADFAEAHREAKDTADKLNAGRGAALELSGADRDSYLSAMRQLRPLDVPLNVAVAEYVKAKAFNVPIVEAVKTYAESHNAKLPDKSIAEVYQEMLAAKRRDGASEAYLHDLKTRLGAFSRDFKALIADVQTSDLDAWLRRLKLAPRSRNNHRNVIVSLFNFAKAAGYLNRDKSTAAEHTALAKTKGKAISFFSPQDMAKLLSSDDKVIRPMFVLGGFCGLRTAEILRLSWEDIRWAESSIVISEDVSKGGEARRRRIAPLTVPAAAWLADWKDERGRVLPIDQPEHRVKDVCDTTEVKWKKNGLRHSFITYRVATEKDFVKVAYEAGNSPAMIRSNYDAVATEQEGKLWFAIMPKVAANVVPMGAIA
ncbi:MAG: tyrosine-type recombinase/integrase [Methylacidiphilales bacterium]|nr:tyrosine-type recombinase/integrase [Candidatus Methylacidiphilales bacterium]